MGYWPSNFLLLLLATSGLIAYVREDMEETVSAWVLFTGALAYHHWQHHVTSSTGVVRQDLWRLSAAALWTVIFLLGLLLL